MCMKYVVRERLRSGSFWFSILIIALGLFCWYAEAFGELPASANSTYYTPTPAYDSATWPQMTPGDPLVATWFNRARNSVDAVQQELGLNPSGDYDTVAERLEALEVKWDNVYIVAKDGGHYNTIPNALAAITDADEDNQYVVMLCPGVYEETFTIKDYVHIFGLDNRSCIIKAPVYMTEVHISILQNLRFYVTDSNMYGVVKNESSEESLILLVNCTAFVESSATLIKTIDNPGSTIIYLNLFDMLSETNPGEGAFANVLYCDATYIVASNSSLSGSAISVNVHPPYGGLQLRLTNCRAENFAVTLNGTECTIKNSHIDGSIVYTVYDAGSGLSVVNSTIYASADHCITTIPTLPVYLKNSIFETNSSAKYCIYSSSAATIGAVGCTFISRQQGDFYFNITNSLYTSDGTFADAFNNVAVYK